MGAGTVCRAGRRGWRSSNTRSSSCPRSNDSGTRWPLTALAGADIKADVAAVETFNARYVHGGPEVQSLEARVASPTEIRAIRAAVPPRYELYLEVQLGGDLPALLGAVRQAGAMAKIRTGGIRASEIPAPEAVLEFLAEAARARLPFKATAGLHHPVRGLAPLTYEPGSACGHYVRLPQRRPRRGGAVARAHPGGGAAPAHRREPVRACGWATRRSSGQAFGTEVEEIVRARREFMRCHRFLLVYRAIGGDRAGMSESLLDATHDPARQSWLPAANAAGAAFPVQNLPLGVFRATMSDRPRIGVAIGDRVLDLVAALEVGCLELPERLAAACHLSQLNGLMAQPVEARRALRSALSALLFGRQPAGGGPRPA